jgi:16S rRNA (guanine527-N7)-methyltransferase
MSAASPFTAALSRLGLDNSDDVLAQIAQFKDYLLAVNRKINLVSRQNSPQVIDDLICDSLAMLEHIRYSPNARLLDIGSGAGFPWIIHKIVHPWLRVISVDANSRKIEFQRAAARRLDLRDCELRCARVESLPPQGADCCIAKAVGSVDLLCKLAQPHLASGGKLILPRSLEDSFSQSASITLGFALETDLIYEAGLDHRQARLLVLVLCS